jgi:hypothetical protein
MTFTTRLFQIPWLVDIRGDGKIRIVVDNANARYAGYEAKELASRGIELLERIPSTPERMGLGIGLQNAFGTAFVSIQE